MELWEAEPGHKVACIRSIRGEIPIPDYDLGSGPLIVTKRGDVAESAAVADDILVEETVPARS
jgi:hypothetical protein